MSVTTTDRLRALVGRTEPTALGAVGLVATAVAFTVTAGPLGASAGLALAVLGLFAPAVVVFALGQAVVLALLASPTPLQLAAVEGALFVLLVGPATRGRPARLVGLSAVLFAAGGGAVWYGARTLGIQWTAVSVVLAATLLLYGVHRYERVAVVLAGGESA